MTSGDLSGSGPVWTVLDMELIMCQRTWFVFLEKSRPWIIKVDDDGLS